MAQDKLNDFVICTQLIQVRRNATSEPMPAIPFQPDIFYERTDDSQSQLVKSIGLPSTEWNITPVAGFPMEIR